MAIICIGSTLSGERCARVASARSNYCCLHEPDAVIFTRLSRGTKKSAAKKAIKKAAKKAAKKK